MSYSNNNGSLPTPQFITTVDLTVTNRQRFVKYFNYNVFNFAKQYSDPLILPFNVTVDVVYHGDIDIGSSKFRSTTFAVDSVLGNKFHITGEGTAYFWYRYGSIDPGSFDLIAKSAINNKDWIVLDAILHTRSFVEAVDFVVNNPESMGIFAGGIDWQFNEIGAKDFFAYLTGNVYDTRKLAQFLTILAYIDPEVLEKEGIPVYKYDNPNRSFEAYINYLPTSFIVPIVSEIDQLSENLILFTDGGKIVNEVLSILMVLKSVIITLKILQHVIKAIAPTSDLVVLSDVGDVLNSVLGITSEGISNVSDVLTVGDLLNTLTELLNNLLKIKLPIMSESSSSSQSSSQSSSNNNNGIGLGLNLNL